MTTNWHDLIQRYISGTITEAETEALEQQLKTDAALRDWYLDALNLDSALELTAEAAELALSLPVPPSHRVFTLGSSQSFRWLSWRPLTAAAAGLLIGMFCTSMVFAYVAPSLGKAMSLLQDGFESGPAPLVTGVPLEPGKWSGDYSEVVEQQGVRPASGKNMLRFLRGDYEGRDIPSSHSSDVFRLVDVRPFRREFADGGAVVQLTAVFNAVPFPADESFNATLTLFALDASLVGNEAVKGENVLSVESLAV
jgi:hypothetical protein